MTTTTTFAQNLRVGDRLADFVDRSSGRVLALPVEVVDVFFEPAFFEGVDLTLLVGDETIEITVNRYSEFEVN